MSLPYNAANNVVDIDALRSALPNTPDEILLQLHAPHGRNKDFHDYYDDLDIAAVRWQKVDLSANKLCRAVINPKFMPYVQMTRERILSLDFERLNKLDGRPAVVESWRRRRTWLVAPVLLEETGASDCSYRLMEGHTRIGVLCALVGSRVIDEGSLHAAWVGKIPGLVGH